MKIRKFKESDLPIILDIYSKSKLDELFYEKSKFELILLENDSARLKELLESVIYVYEDDAVVGYGALFGNEIRGLFVYPSHRRKGIGKSIFEYLLSKTTGQASLYVAKSNMPAKNLYTNYGFELVEEFNGTYNNNNVVVNKMVRSSKNG